MAWVQVTAGLYGLIRDAKYNNAIKLLEEQLEYFQDSHAALSLSAYCHYMVGNFHAAASLYEQLTKGYPTEEKYAMYHAQSLYKGGMYSNAARACMSVEGNQTRVINLQACIRHEQGDISETAYRPFSCISGSVLLTSSVPEECTEDTVKQKHENSENMLDYESWHQTECAVDSAWTNNLRSYPRKKGSSSWMPPEGDLRYDYGEESHTLKVPRFPPSEVFSYPESPHFGRPAIGSQLNLLLTRDPGDLSRASSAYETRGGWGSQFPRPSSRSTSVETQKPQSRVQRQITSRNRLRPLSRMSRLASREQSYPNDLSYDEHGRGLTSFLVSRKTWKNSPASLHGSEKRSRYVSKFTRRSENPKLLSPTLKQDYNVNDSHGMSPRSKDFLDLIGLFEEPETLMEDREFQYIAEEVQDAIKSSVERLLSSQQDETYTHSLTSQAQDSEKTQGHRHPESLPNVLPKSSSGLRSIGKAGVFSLSGNGVDAKVRRPRNGSSPNVLQSHPRLSSSNKLQSVPLEVNRRISGPQGLDVSLPSTPMSIVQVGSRTQGPLHQAELPSTPERLPTKEETEDAFFKDCASYESMTRSLDLSDPAFSSTNSFSSSQVNTTELKDFTAPTMSVSNLDGNTPLPSVGTGITSTTIVQDKGPFIKQIICVVPGASKERKLYIDDAEHSRETNNQKTTQPVKASKQLKVPPPKRSLKKVSIVEVEKEVASSLKGKVLKKQDGRQNVDRLRNFKKADQERSMKKQNLLNDDPLRKVRQPKHGRDVRKQHEFLNLDRVRNFTQAEPEKSMKHDANQETPAKRMKTLLSDGQQFKPRIRTYLQSYILKSGVKLPIYDGYLQQYYIQRLEAEMAKAHNEPDPVDIFTSAISEVQGTKDRTMLKSRRDSSEQRPFDPSLSTHSTAAQTSSMGPPYRKKIPKSDFGKMSYDLRSTKEERNLSTLSKELSDVMTASNKTFITELNNKRLPKSDEGSLAETSEPIAELLVQYEELKNYIDTVFQNFVPKGSMPEFEPETTQTGTSDQRLAPEPYQVVSWIHDFETNQALRTTTRPRQETPDNCGGESRPLETSKAQLLDSSDKDMLLVSGDLSNPCRLEQSEDADNHLQKSLTKEPIEEQQQSDSHLGSIQSQSTLSQDIIEPSDETQKLSRSSLIIQKLDLSPVDTQPQSALSQDIGVSSDQPQKPSHSSFIIEQQHSSPDSMQPQSASSQDTAMSSDQPWRSSVSSLIIQEQQKEDTSPHTSPLQVALPQDTMESSDQSRRSPRPSLRIQHQLKQQGSSLGGIQPQSTSTEDTTMRSNESDTLFGSPLMPKVKPSWNSSIVITARKPRRSSAIIEASREAPLTLKPKSLSYTETQKSWEKVSYTEMLESREQYTGTQNLQDRSVSRIRSNLEDQASAASSSTVFVGPEGVLLNSITKVPDFSQPNIESTTSTTSSMTSRPVPVTSATPKPATEDALEILKSRGWNQRRSSLPEYNQLCFDPSQIQHNARRQSTGKIKVSVTPSEHYFKSWLGKPVFSLSKIVPFLTSAETPIITTEDLTMISDSDTNSTFASAVSAQSDFQEVNSDSSTYVKVTSTSEETTTNAFYSSTSTEHSTEQTTHVSSEALEVPPSSWVEKKQSVDLNAPTITETAPQISSPSAIVHQTGTATYFASQNSTTPEVSPGQKFILEPSYVRSELSTTSQTPSLFPMPFSSKTYSSDSTMNSANNIWVRRRTSMASMELERYLPSTLVSSEGQTNADVNQYESSPKRTDLIHPQESGATSLSIVNDIQGVNRTDIQPIVADSFDSTSETYTIPDPNWNLSLTGSAVSLTSDSMSSGKSDTTTNLPKVDVPSTSGSKNSTSTTDTTLRGNLPSVQTDISLESDSTRFLDTTYTTPNLRGNPPSMEVDVSLSSATASSVSPSRAITQEAKNCGADAPASKALLNVVHERATSDASTVYGTLANSLATNTEVSRDIMNPPTDNFISKTPGVPKPAYFHPCIACIAANGKMSKPPRYPRVLGDDDGNIYLGDVLRQSFDPRPGDVMIVRESKQHHFKHSGYVCFYTRQHTSYDWCVGDFILRSGKFYGTNKWYVSKQCKLYQRTHDKHWMLVGLVERPDHMLPLVMNEQLMDAKPRSFVPRRGDFIVRMRALEGPSQLEVWTFKTKINPGDILARVYVGDVGLRCDPKDVFEGQVELYVCGGKSISWTFMGRDICRFRDGHDLETKSGM